MENPSKLEQIARLLDDLAIEARKFDKSTENQLQKLAAFKTRAKEKIATLMFNLLA